jgi:endonuclease YncB( thermonuclease family)
MARSLPLFAINTPGATRLTMSFRTLFLLLAILSVPAIAEPIDSDDVRVIDGDTIRVYHEQPNVRLVGFNAPETRRAACETERELGAKATRRLRDLVRAGNLDFVYVACSCPAGTAGTPACNYGRDCGTLKSGGRDVGAILIEEGLAVPFVCGATRCPKTPRPWCQ